MIDEKNPILNPQAEGNNTASGSKNKGKERAAEIGGNFASSSRTNKQEINNSGEIIRPQELDTEKELFNLKNKVAAKGKNESFLEFEKANEVIKSVYKNYSLSTEWKKTQKQSGEESKKLTYLQKVRSQLRSIKNKEDIKSGLEKTFDFGLREVIPFYGSFTKSDREKQLEKIIEYYQEQFSQLTTSIANDQENIFSEVKNVLKEKNRKIDGMTKVMERLREQANTEKEIRDKKEKEIKELKEQEEKEKKANEEKKKEIEKAKEKNQKALQSAERVEIEQLRSESNRANKTAQELENGLKAWIRAYDQLKLDKQIVINQWEALYLDYENREKTIKQRNADIEIQNLNLEQLRSDKIALNADNTGYKETIKNLTKDIKETKDKIKELESDKVNLEAKVTDLEADKNDWKEKYEKEKQQKRIGLIANVAQGAVEWLPIPEKWQSGLKTSIQAVSMWALFKDLPNWTYEGFIMVTGVGLWYAIIHILRKINRFIFGKKEKKQISNLEKALTNIIEAGSIGKNKKEPKNPAVVSKEVIITGEVKEISSENENKEKEPQEQEKTDPKISGQKESEKIPKKSEKKKDN